MISRFQVSDSAFLIVFESEYIQKHFFIAKHNPKNCASLLIDEKEFMFQIVLFMVSFNMYMIVPF